MVTPPVVIVALHASRCAGIALGLLATGTAGIVLILPLPLWAQAGLIVVLATWSTVWFQRVALRVGRFAVTEIRVAANRLIAVRYGAQPLVAGHVRCASYVGLHVTTIVWRPDGARWSRTVLILPDMLPEEHFRQLRVLLRYGHSEPAPQVSARWT